MKQSLRELTTTKQQVANLSERMNDAYKIIHKLQLFLEALDNKDRKLNLILTGVSESADELGCTDEEKISKVMEATECDAAADRGGWVIPAQYGALARNTTDQDKVIVLGDFNVCVATPLLADRDGNYYQYQGVQDNVVKEHGRTLLNICNNNGLTVANHLYHNGNLLGGDLSFRRRGHWISEIDLCIIKNECADMITNLNVDQTIPRSDHAPLCVTVAIAARQAVSPAELLHRASALGEPQYAEKIQPSLPKSMQYKTVDPDVLTRELQETPTPILAENSEVCDVEAAG
ncbi:hypothetical protein Pcinc_009627 [Petrolisthes cinctipes]|uniref:Endonuclease/exonuclease/phosphatase domain-containing protein n=1 Tax=Petrolisthes cinctipes TaxID=88211 RepID=A0AAE1KW63_PETCI|nr:hypothetical protein Pcinc_009627 [Petrolisthes cinctipes]